MAEEKAAATDLMAADVAAMADSAAGGFG